MSIISQQITEILKKITYIEADLEIQKQILFSIPSANRVEMEQVIELIAEKKEMINDLRDQIKSSDPVEFERILKFENAAAEFKKIGAKKQFSEIVTLNGSEPCTLSLRNGKIVDCIVKAQEKQTGDWIVMTIDGEILQIAGADKL